MKNIKAITLISLIITIIVILILTGVALNLLTGENGILNRTKDLREQTEDAHEKEKIQLAIIATQTNNKGELTTEGLNNELQKAFYNETTVTEFSKGWHYIASKSYIIYKN